MRACLVAWTLALLCGASLAGPGAAGVELRALGVQAAACAAAAGDRVAERVGAAEVEPGSGESDASAAAHAPATPISGRGAPGVPQRVMVPRGPWLGGLLRPPCAA